MKKLILSHIFPNGLVLVAEPIKSLQSAAFTLLVPAGCSRDPKSLSGLSGFTCEMTLRGAGKRGSRQFIADLDHLGVERGESVSPSHASYSGATVAVNLREALAIFADVLQRPHLPDDQIEAGRQVMLQELQTVEDDPAQKTMLELRRQHYPAPWGQPSHGNRESLEAISIDDIKRHFEMQFRPNGTILGVAGKFDWEELKDLVENLIDGWGQRESEKLEEVELGQKYVHIPYDSNQTHIGISYPSVPYRHPDYFQAWGALGVLSGGMSARLFTEVRERRGLCYTVYASYNTLKDRAGVFAYAGTSSERAQETLNVMCAELVRLGEGVEQTELDRLKARIKSALVMQHESSSARSDAVARDWFHLGRARTLDEIGQIIDDLSCESINKYLAKNLPQDFKVVTLGQNELEVPGGIS